MFPLGERLGTGCVDGRRDRLAGGAAVRSSRRLAYVSAKPSLIQRDGLKSSLNQAWPTSWNDEGRVEVLADLDHAGVLVEPPGEALEDRLDALAHDDRSIVTHREPDQLLEIGQAVPT